MSFLMRGVAALATVLIASACNRGGASASDVLLAKGVTQEQSWTTKFLNAGADGTAPTSTNLTELKARHRAGAFDTIRIDMPSGAAPGDALKLVARASDSTLDADMYLLDSSGKVLRVAASSSSVETIGNLTVRDVSWPATVFISAFAPLGKVGSVTVTGTIQGSEVDTASTASALVDSMQDLCSRAAGTFLSRGDNSRCQCDGSVITFDRFRSEFVDGVKPAEARFLAECGKDTTTTLVSQMARLCKLGEGDFLGRSTSSRCLCKSNAITFDRFQSDFVRNGSVQDQAFLDSCHDNVATASDPVSLFRNACTANASAGAVLSGTGQDSACDCRGWNLFFNGFKSSYLDQGRTADNFRADCSAAMR